MLNGATVLNEVGFFINFLGHFEKTHQITPKKL